MAMKKGYKQTEVGIIPMNWDAACYGDVVETNMPPVDMHPDEMYSPVIVRRRHNGLEIRETKRGGDILVKKQFKALPGTLLISKRQIVHGSCGLVPDDIGENAIISKEYLALQANAKKLDIRFLDYFAQMPMFQSSIVRTTYGVDDEKFVFKDQWWMKEKLPLPPSLNKSRSPQSSPPSTTKSPHRKKSWRSFRR
jgi:type I restriction enzyme S subunit